MGCITLVRGNMDRMETGWPVRDPKSWKTPNFFHGFFFSRQLFVKTGDASTLLAYSSYTHLYIIRKIYEGRVYLGLESFFFQGKGHCRSMEVCGDSTPT